MGRMNRQLDPTLTGTEAVKLEADLRRRIVGQDEAIDQIVNIYQTFLAGMSSPGRPIGNFLFLGPTGSGKTRMVEATAESLVGDSARGHQDRLRGVPAQPRDRQIDRFASRISGASRNAPAAEPGSAAAASHRQDQAELRAVRRDREGQRLAVEPAAGNSGQGHPDAGRQPPRRFFARHDLHDQQPGRGRNEFDHASQLGICGFRNGTQVCRGRGGRKPRRTKSRAPAWKPRGASSRRSS